MADESSVKAELATMRKRFQLCSEAEAVPREASLDDLKHLSGDQWSATDLAEREADGRPALTINRLRQFVRQVTNAQRMNRTSSSVHPVDDGADIDTADVLQGLIRHIEYDSSALVAYATAAFYAAAIGFGYYFVDTEHCDPLSFNLDIKIRRIRNPFTVYMDPSAQDPHGADGRFCFIVQDLTEEEYKEAYPKAAGATSGSDEWASVGDTAASWVTDQRGVRVVRYYFRDSAPDTLYQLTDGSTVLKSKLPKTFDETLIAVDEAGEKIERPTTVPVIRAWKSDGIERLEHTILPGSGKWLPVFRVIGEELDIDGKLMLSGVVRDAKDPQRQYNFMATAETEGIALTPKAPWQSAFGQVTPELEKDYAASNRKNVVMLRYLPKAHDGQLLPPPSRISVEPAVAAATNARINAAHDMEATTGIYQAQLGAPSSERSGRAIDARKEQGETGNYHYVDNLHLSISQSTRLLVDWIPDVYDTKRTIRVIGEDDSPKIIKVNQEIFGDDGKPQMGKDGKPKVHRIGGEGVGKYDVISTTAQSFETKRQQAAQAIMELVGNYPALMQIAGDLLMKTLDIPYAMELAERLKKTLPPELRDQDDEGKVPVPPEVQQKLSLLMAQHEQLTNALNQANDAIEMKQVEQNGKLEIVKLQERTKIITAMIAAKSKADAQTALREAEHELSELDKDHEAMMEAFDHQHDHDIIEHEHEKSVEQNAQLGAQQADLAAQNAAMQPPTAT